MERALLITVDMRKREDWNDFKHFAWKRWCIEVDNDLTDEQGDDWLINPTRFCELAVEFLKEKG